MKDKDLIHSRRVTWQKFLESEWNSSVVPEHSNKISAFLGSGLAACVSLDPHFVDIDELKSDQDVAQLISQYYHMSMVAVYTLIDLIDSYSGYDLGMSMIAMPIYPRIENEKNGFWANLKNKLPGS